jgi:hypothetical protein
MSATQQRSPDAEKWWLTLAGAPSVCETCDRTIPTGGDIVFRYEPKGVLCPRCAEADPSVVFKASKKWKQAQQREQPVVTSEAERRAYAEGHRQGRKGVDRLTAEVERLRYEADVFRLEIERLRRAQPDSPPPDLVKRAIRLCHPDRHPAERFDEANALTRDLNALHTTPSRR